VLYSLIYKSAIGSALYYRPDAGIMLKTACEFRWGGVKNMKRRQILIGTGGIAAAGIGAAAFATTTAAAEIETGLFGIEETYDIDSQSGRLSSLTVGNIGAITKWYNFDRPVESVDWTLEVSLDGDDAKEIGTATVDELEPAYSNESGVTAKMDDVDLVEVFGRDAFEVESNELYDGEDVTENFDLEFVLTVVVTDVQGDYIEESVSGATDLGITNLGADVSTGGSGELSDEDESGDEYDNG